MYKNGKEYLDSLEEEIYEASLNLKRLKEMLKKATTNYTSSADPKEIRQDIAIVLKELEYLSKIYKNYNGQKLATANFILTAKHQGLDSDDINFVYNEGGNK